MKNALLLVVLIAAAPARAIELSLEENRAERGSVGFVDMQRLFSGSPDAARAKEAFAELARQADERVNARKAELIKLRQELAAVKVERDALAVSTPALPAPPAAPPAAPKAEPAKPAPAATAAPAASTKTIALPGMSDMGGLTPPASSTAPAKTEPAKAPVPPPPPAAPSGPTVPQQIIALDGRIVGLTGDIERKEAELKRERDEADRGLSDVESRKTDQVLARLYRAISEVSRQEGVSVVVDKANIIFGHPAVDLTDKVLAHLRQPAREPAR
jgi:Skp family chaperone for outer membrane proteins